MIERVLRLPCDVTAVKDNTMISVDKVKQAQLELEEIQVQSLKYLDLVFKKLKSADVQMREQGDVMLMELTEALIQHDARTEWGEYTSISELIEKSLLPKVEACRQFVNKLVSDSRKIALKDNTEQHRRSTSTVLKLPLHI